MKIGGKKTTHFSCIITIRFHTPYVKLKDENDLKKNFGELVRVLARKKTLKIIKVTAVKSIKFE